MNEHDFKQLLEKISKQTFSGLYLHFEQLNDEQILMVLDKVASNSNIKELNLSNNKLGPKVVTAIADLLDHRCALTKLTLANTHLEDEAGVTIANALKNNKTLTYLNLRNNCIGSQAGLAFADCLLVNNQLTMLILDDNNLDNRAGIAIAQALEKNKSVQCIELSDNRLGVEAVEAFRLMAKNKNPLIYLDFNNCSVYNPKKSYVMDTEDFKILLERIENDISSISIEGVINLAGLKLNDEQVIAIVSKLKNTDNIKTLNLSGNVFGGLAAKAIAEFLANQATLAELNLSRNNLDAEAGIALAHALKTNRHLTHLALQNNNFGPEAGLAFAECLSKNTHLLSLNLSSNNVGTQAGVAIANSLVQHRSLQALNLAYNNLSVEGGQAFKTVIENNNALTCLDLSGNHLDNSTCVTFIEVLQRNTSLTSLGLDRNGIDFLIPDAKTRQSKAAFNKALSALTRHPIMIDISFEGCDIDDESKKILLEMRDYHKASHAACYRSAYSVDGMSDKQLARCRQAFRADHLRPPDALFDFVGLELKEYKNLICLYAISPRYRKHVRSGTPDYCKYYCNYYYVTKDKIKEGMKFDFHIQQKSLGYDEKTRGTFWYYLEPSLIEQIIKAEEVSHSMTASNHNENNAKGTEPVKKDMQKEKKMEQETTRGSDNTSLPLINTPSLERVTNSSMTYLPQFAAQKMDRTPFVLDVPLSASQQAEVTKPKESLLSSSIL